MTSSELKSRLKRLKSSSETLSERCGALIKRDEAFEDISGDLIDVSKTVERIASDLYACRNLRAVVFCPRCVNFTSVSTAGGSKAISKCLKTGLPVGDCDYCSKYKPRPDTLCWDCKNSTNNGCEWSRSFKPVEGWNAVPSAILVGGANDKYTDSYLVLECPKFERG